MHIKLISGNVFTVVSSKQLPHHAPGHFRAFHRTRNTANEFPQNILTNLKERVGLSSREKRPLSSGSLDDYYLKSRARDHDGLCPSGYTALLATKANGSSGSSSRSQEIFPAAQAWIVGVPHCCRRVKSRERKRGRERSRGFSLPFVYLSRSIGEPA